MLFVVYYSYYQSHLALRAQHLIDLLTRLERIPMRLLIVSPNNTDHLESQITSAFRGIQLSRINHDNSGWEFGAYQRGLNYIKTHSPNSNTLIVNDTIGIRQLIGRPELSHLAHALQYAEDHPTCAIAAGEIDQFLNADYTAYNLPLQRWIRTSLLLLSNQTLSDIDWTIHHDRIYNDTIVDNHIPRNPNLSDSLNSHIREWLSPSNPKGWHSRNSDPLKNENFLRQKFASIVNEKVLSATLISKGIPMIPITPLGGVRRVIYRARRRILLGRGI